MWVRYSAMVIMLMVDQNCSSQSTGPVPRCPSAGNLTNDEMSSLVSKIDGSVEEHLTLMIDHNGLELVEVGIEIPSTPDGASRWLDPRRRELRERF